MSKKYSSKKNEHFKEKIINFAFTENMQKELGLYNTHNQHTKCNQIHKAKKNTKSKKSILKTFLLICIITIVIFFVPYLSIAFNSYIKGFDTSRIDIETVPHIYDSQR